MFKRLACSTVCLLITASFLTAADTLWTRVYGGTGNEIAYSVIEASGGHYLAAGYTTSFGAGNQDGWLLKLDKSGDTLWSKAFGGTGYDGLHCVIESTDGGYLLVGFTESFGSGGKDVYLVKTDADGNEQWTKTYGESLQDVGYAACEASGGYVICGYIDGPSAWNKGDAWILKIDENGDLLWDKQYGGPGEDYCISVRPESTGFIMSGVNSASGSKDAWLVRIDDAGDTLWTSIFGGGGQDVSYGVGLSHDGGYVITGYADGTGAWTPGDLWIIKTDSGGAEEWRKTYSAGPENFGFDIYPTTDGGYVVAGLKGSNGGDLWILKTDEAGDTTWTGAWGGVGRDNALSLCITSDGGYLAGGMSTEGSSPALYLVKTQPVLELGSPDGGENLPAGGTYTIRWHVENHPQPPHFFTLLYSIDGGTSYDSVIATEISPEDTSYNWSVPVLETQTCRVKVQLFDGFFDLIAEDESEANFIIAEGIEETGSTQTPWIKVSNASIRYHVTCEGKIRIAVYDAAGRQAAVLLDAVQGAGNYTLSMPDAVPGVYYVVLKAGQKSFINKAVLTE